MKRAMQAIHYEKSKNVDGSMRACCPTIIGIYFKCYINSKKLDPKRQLKTHALL